MLPAVCLALSGTAALICQVVWTRALGFSLGSSHAAVATVLVAFFLGLTLGSLSAPRGLARASGPWALYRRLELSIAAWGLLLIPVLFRLDELVASAPALFDHTPGRLVLTLLLLLPATFAMGASFPVVARAVLAGPGSATGRLAALNAANTTGACAGALLAAFVLVPLVQLDGALVVAAGLNVLAACVALGLRDPLPATTRSSGIANAEDEHASSGEPLAEPSHPGVGSTEAPAYSPARALGLTALIATGGATLASEVAWTRYASILTGATMYGFASILAVILAGMALGSWFVRRHPPAHAERWLMHGLVLLAAALIATRSLLGQLPNWLADQDLGVWSLGARVAAVAAVLAPSTVLFGALFPVSLALARRPGPRADDGVGPAYALNTLAGIGGALAAGHWLIPSVGTDLVLLLAAWLVLTPVVLRALTGLLRRRGHPISVLGLVLIALVLAAPRLLPGIDYAALLDAHGYRYDVDVAAGATPERLFLREGNTGVISAVTYDESVVILRNNGLNESRFEPGNPRHAPTAEVLLGVLPVLLHPDPKSAFIVGFGGGVTTRAMAWTDVQRITSVELEPAVVEAVRAVTDGQHEALTNPKVELRLGDARHELLARDDAYDVIVSQPSHPWLAGAGHLFTLEFFELVRRRLEPGGVFCQWLNLFQMDRETLRSILGAFYDTFPEGAVFMVESSSDLLMVGSETPLRFDIARVGERIQPRDLRAALAAQRIRKPAQFLRHLLIDANEARALAGDAPRNTDRNILSEVRLTDLHREMSEAEAALPLLLESRSLRVTPLLAPRDRREALVELADHLRTLDREDLALLLAEQLAELDGER